MWYHDFTRNSAVDALGKKPPKERRLTKQMCKLSGSSSRYRSTKTPRTLVQCGPACRLNVPRKVGALAARGARNVAIRKIGLARVRVLCFWAECMFGLQNAPSRQITCRVAPSKRESPLCGRSVHKPRSAMCVCAAHMVEVPTGCSLRHNCCILVPRRSVE